MMTRTGAPNPVILDMPFTAVADTLLLPGICSARTAPYARALRKASSKIWQPTPLSRPPRCRDANPVRFPLATAGGNPLLLHPCNSAPVRGKDDRIGRRRIAVIGRQNVTSPVCASQQAIRFSSTNPRLSPEGCQLNADWIPLSVCVN